MVVVADNFMKLDIQKLKYETVNKFLTKEGFIPKIIKEKLDGVYGQSSPSYSAVKECAKRFRMTQDLESQCM